MAKAAQVANSPHIHSLTAEPMGSAVRASLRLAGPPKLDMHTQVLFLFYPEELVTLQTYS